MAADDKDTKELKKKAEEMKKLIEAQEKLTNDMMKLVKKMDDQKQLETTLGNIMKASSNAKRDIIKNMKS